MSARKKEQRKKADEVAEIRVTVFASTIRASLRILHAMPSNGRNTGHTYNRLTYGHVFSLVRNNEYAGSSVVNGRGCADARRHL